MCGPAVVGVFATSQELEPKPVISFPTRRSSDLIGLEKVPVFAQLTVPVGAVAIPPGVVSVTVAVQLLAPPTGTLAGRSEEHTAELQSRGEIVGGLLLAR